MGKLKKLSEDARVSRIPKALAFLFNGNGFVHRNISSHEDENGHWCYVSDLLSSKHYQQYREEDFVKAFSPSNILSLSESDDSIFKLMKIDDKLAVILQREYERGCNGRKQDQQRSKEVMGAAAHSEDDARVLIECSLCLSTFKQPKCLPCVHTFCLDCLQKYVDKNGIRDKFPCPLCRRMCFIPPQGLDCLPNNFFILRMIEVESKAKVESGKLTVEVKCDICLNENNVESSPIASQYCSDCRQNMCKSCLAYHGKMNSTKYHTLLVTSEKLKYSASDVNNQPAACGKHASKPMNLYCLKCDVCMCVSCMLKEHNEHKCEDIEDTFDRYLGQVDTNISALNEVLTIGCSSAEGLKSAEDQVIKKTSRNEQKIKEKCDELRKMLDYLEEKLLSEARLFRDKRVKEIKSQLDQVEFQNLQLESFVRYLRGIKEKGSNYDVASSGKELVARAEQLMTSSKETYKQELKMIHMTFLPTNESVGVEFGTKMIGELVIGEKLLIAHCLNVNASNDQKICQISLDKPDKIAIINSTPTRAGVESAFCVVNNTLYAVGIGNASNELWAWSVNRDEWTRCADMLAGRRRHCVTSVGDKIYVLGGWVDDDERILDRILCYDINSNKWSEAGQLCHAVQSATCVTYKHYVYVFGGLGKDTEAINHVQVYDTTTRKVSLASNPKYAAYNLIRAVLWRSKALLLGRYFCYIYDFESSTWQERKRFKTDVVYFGLTLDDNTLYISGGGTSSDAGVWTCRADVKSLSVDDFISDNKEAEWKHHATLPTPALISAYSSTPLYVTF